MKKWMSIAAAFLLGVVVTLSAGDVSARVKSLIGQKVTGEYTVIVNGNELADKGAIIDSKANVPARAFSEALGADVQVSGKTIYVTTVDAQSSESAGNETAGAAPAANSGASNKYIGGSKDSLETLKNSIQNNRIKPTLEGKEELTRHLEEAKKGDNKELINDFEKRIAEYDEILKSANEELRLVEEALAQFKD